MYTHCYQKEEIHTFQLVEILTYNIMLAYNDNRQYIVVDIGVGLK